MTCYQISKSLALPLILLISTACQPLEPLAAPPAEGAMETEMASPHAVEFEAIDIACADGNVILSESPFMAGRSDISIEREENSLNFSVSSTAYPSAFPNGTWIAPGAGLDTADGFIVYHSGDGAGELAGSRILYIATPTEVADPPCEPVGPVVKLKGVVISPLVETGSGITATEFSDIDVACADGGVTISDEPLDAGRSEIEIVREEGSSLFLVNVTQYPDAYPGSTWVAPGYAVDTLDGGFLVIHRGEGTGDLANDKMFYMVTPAADLSDLPCEPVGPVVDRKGVIIQTSE